MVGNPQMEDIAKLTKSTFTKDTGIKVNFTVLPENELRDKVTQDIATQAGQYDVATIGAYEVPIWEKNGWLHDLGSYADKDKSFDKADLLKPMVQSLTGSDGKLYALPFYGESSMLMYNEDVMKAKGVTVPEHPTWQQIADIAAKVDGAEPGMKGICLRGLAGWGELGAPLTSMVNTFGGTWFTKDWKAQVNSGGFKDATKFYVDLVRRHGEAGAPQAGFTKHKPRRGDNMDRPRKRPSEHLHDKTGFCPRPDRARLRRGRCRPADDALAVASARRTAAVTEDPRGL
jgi:sorbitol/mannitol transport system substrate-binding protein